MMSLANQVYRRMFFKEKKTKYVLALIIAVSKKAKGRDPLLVQWLIICHAFRGTWVLSLVGGEKLTCHRETKAMPHSF